MSLATTSEHLTTTKQRAIEDAKATQASSVRECADNGREPPPYQLTELIGRGTFGRVYKAISSSSPHQLVAVKVISIEEGDLHQPGAADTFTDILKELNTLKLLRYGGAKNINNIVDALLVGHSIWMITEYCAGGSVASLMRPTGGLAEKWIIPILREVAEALYWVHRKGVIHRDVKCANVLVAESGAIQLCDFGVAGIIESKFDKRKTVTGTINWMAPELFDPTVAYGTEVDIWAFGAMAYEIATGLPPNATTRIHISEFGSYLKSHCPRLEGDQYSSNLKNMVAFCMVEDPSRRPEADDILAHPLLLNTATKYPTTFLAELVQAYKDWEARGGSRQSLFTPAGAQGPTHEPLSVLDEGWNFGTVDLNQTTDQDTTVETACDAYDPDVNLVMSRKALRRRRPPPPASEMKVPLQKMFDPNTMTKYEDSSRAFYGKFDSSSDLPLRDNAAGPMTVRESLIDLDVSLDGRSLAEVADVETIKYRPRSSHETEIHRPKTQDWTFPIMAPSASASFDEPYSSPSTSSTDTYRASVMSQFHVDASSPVSTSSSADVLSQFMASNRVSSASLIDLDAAVPSPAPSHTSSDTASADCDTPFSLQAPDQGITESKSYVAVDHEPDLPAPDGLRLLPNIPAPPSATMMAGLAEREEMKAEFLRLLGSFGEHLQLAKDVLGDQPGKSTGQP